MSSNEKNIDQLLKESVQFEIENPIDFSHVYLIQITNSKKLVITEQKEDKKVISLTLQDPVQKVSYTEDFEVFEVENSYVIEDKNSYIKKLIANYLILEDIEFSYKKFTIEQYRSIMYNKED